MKIMSMKRHVVVAETQEDILALAKTAGLTARMPENEIQIFISDEDDPAYSFATLKVGIDALIVEPNAGETIWYVDSVLNVQKDYTPVKEG